MAVKIRLKRVGKKKQPYYRVVVADIRSPRDGRFIEEIGTYDPHTQPSTFKVDAERVKYWLETGAQTTETIRKLLQYNKVLEDGDATEDKETQAEKVAVEAPVRAEDSDKEEAEVVAEEKE
ncbi:MAG: 30S ribosomal protein S16 [Fastidiosipila sp.]|nr:30S ribosomal protein S16 [Fastidiosipila sp.]